MIPKSLHTVTVFVRVAQREMQINPVLTPEQALEHARIILGYTEQTDDYSLLTAALKQLKRGA